MLGADLSVPDADRLIVHLRDVCEVDVAQLTRPQPWCPFVYRIDHAHRSPWIARIFPGVVPLERVRGEAELLRLLEAHGFPAERLASADPISSLDGCTVLLTRFVRGDLFGDRSFSTVDEALAALNRLGSMLGRLHELSPSGHAVPSGVGAWHGDGATGPPRLDAEAALAFLHDVRDRLPDGTADRHESLHAQLDHVDVAEGLPTGLIHPDYTGPNIILAEPDDSPVIIDWSGSGIGPRLPSFAWFLNKVSLRSEPIGDAVDAIVEGYGCHVALEDRELDRLSAVMRLRPLFQATRSFWRAARAGQAPRGAALAWCTDADNDRRDAIAERAVSALRRSGSAINRRGARQHESRDHLLEARRSGVCCTGHICGPAPRKRRSGRRAHGFARSVGIRARRLAHRQSAYGCRDRNIHAVFS